MEAGDSVMSSRMCRGVAWLDVVEEMENVRHGTSFWVGGRAQKALMHVRGDTNIDEIMME